MMIVDNHLRLCIYTYILFTVHLLYDFTIDNFNFK